MADLFTVTLANEAELNRRLGRIVDGLADPKPLLDRIGAKLESNVNMRFDLKVDPGGTPWLPLSKKTLALYEKKYDGSIPGSLLQRTRHMRDSLTHNVGDGWVDVGFGDAIAAYHETGTRRGLPRRSLLADDPIGGTLGDEDREDILTIMNEYLQDLL